MIKMKRKTETILCLVGAVMLCLSTGCGRNSDGTAGPGAVNDGRSNSEPRTSLSFWHIMNYEGPREVLAEAVARFEAAHPDVTIEMETFANDAYKTKLAVEMASGTPPDIFFTWGGGTLAAYAEAEKVRDLTSTLEQRGWKSRFLPQALDMCRVGRGIYAVPVDLSAVLLWYNETLFTQRGINPPATYQGLIETCRNLRKSGLTPIALGNMKQWPGAFHFIYLATRQGGSQLFFDAAAAKPGADFADPAFIEAGRKLRELVSIDAFSTGANGIDAQHARTQFLTGRAAMYLMGTWLVARVKNENPEFLNRMRCVPYPQIENGAGSTNTVVGGVNCAFAISAACRHPELAIELIGFLTDDTVAARWATIGRIPALQVESAVLERLPAPTRTAFDILSTADRLQPYYDQYLEPQLAEEHKKTTQELFAGTLGPEEAAERMKKCADNLQ